MQKKSTTDIRNPRCFCCEINIVQKFRSSFLAYFFLCLLTFASSVVTARLASRSLLFPTSNLLTFSHAYLFGKSTKNINKKRPKKWHTSPTNTLYFESRCDGYMAPYNYRTKVQEQSPLPDKLHQGYIQAPAIKHTHETHSRMRQTAIYTSRASQNKIPSTTEGTVVSQQQKGTPQFQRVRVKNTVDLSIS